MYEVGGEEARPKKKEENSMGKYEEITLEVGFSRPTHYCFSSFAWPPASWGGHMIIGRCTELNPGRGNSTTAKSGNNAGRHILRANKACASGAWRKEGLAQGRSCTIRSGSHRRRLAIQV